MPVKSGDMGVSEKKHRTQKSHLFHFHRRKRGSSIPHSFNAAIFVADKDLSHTTALTKRKGAKLNEGTYVRIKWLCISCPLLVDSRKERNSNREHLFCTSVYRVNAVMCQQPPRLSARLAFQSPSVKRHSQKIFAELSHRNKPLPVPC